MLVDHLVDENRSHSLDSHIQEISQSTYKKDFWDKYDNWNNAPDNDKYNYVMWDVIYTQLADSRILESARVQGISANLVMHVHKLAEALLETRLKGIRVDVSKLVELGTELTGQISSCQEKMLETSQPHREMLELNLWAEAIEKAYTPKGKKWRSIPKPVLNFSSSIQVGKLLYDYMLLPEQKNSKTRNRTVDDDALEKLGDAHPLLPELRNFRKYSKMQAAFIDGIRDKLEGNRIYPDFNINGTVTGRLSHSNPNMAQIPASDEWAKIRNVFIPEEGYDLISADYGMLEVVIAAHYSQDENLLKIIKEGASKHDITAASLGVDRASAKILNFALQYQCGPNKVAKILGVSGKEGQYYFDKYWETYKGEKEVIDACKDMVNNGEPIVTLYGRHRRFPKKFENPWEREAAYRSAYSALIQGSGADLTSEAFYLIAAWLKEKGLGSAWFTVHDEVIVQADRAATGLISKQLEHYMKDVGRARGLSIDLIVEVSEPSKFWTK